MVNRVETSIGSIPEEWNALEFSSVAELKHGYQFRTHDFTEAGLKVFKITQIKSNGEIDISSCDTIDEGRLKDFERVILKKGDVLMALTGATIGKFARYNEDEIALQNYRVGNFFSRDEETLSRDYLYFFLTSKLFFNQILARQTQSAQQNIGNEEINKMLIFLPPLPEQKAIAHVLGTLDDKIELNRRMNETLEGMAQALFKSWFVDFDPVIDNALAAGNLIPEPLAQRAETRRQAIANGTANRETAQAFPASFRFTEELGWIPEGWEELKAESLVNRKKVNQKFTKKNVLDSGEVTVFDQGSGLILGYHDGQPDVESSVENPSFIFGDHTCITHLSTKPFSVGPNVIPLSALDHDPYWTYYAIKDVQTFQEYRRHWMEFKIKSVLVPPKSITSTFGNIVCNFYLAMESNSEESQTLAKLRDVLLPKLISGELRIPQAEKMVEDAIA